MLTVVTIATAAHAAGDAARFQDRLVIFARVRSGFNWSSQHLDNEELQWVARNVDGPIVRDALRCVHPVSADVMISERPAEADVRAADNVIAVEDALHRPCDSRRPRRLDV